MSRSWRPAAFVAAIGVLIALPYLLDGVVVGGGGGVGLPPLRGAPPSPLPFPRAVPATEAGRGGRPIIYWRPGCQFCLRLRIRLGADAGRARWVNIWADEAGAAAVREITGGDETVPTVV